MKVVIAAWHVRDFNVGLGRYARELIEGLGRVDHSTQYTVLLPVGAEGFTPRPNIRFRTVRLPFGKRRVWEQLVPWTGGVCDLLHLPYDSCLAWPRSPVLVTIHDVKPLIFGTPTRRRNLHERLESWAVGDRWAKIDHVVTISQCSRRDILAHCPVQPDRVSVVYAGVDTARFTPYSGADSPHAHRPQRPYVLCVAGDDPAKNVETLVDAFAQLPPALREAHELVLVGDVQKRQVVRQRVAQHRLEAQVCWMGLVDDATLIGLYRGARVFAFPSRYEGFGLPPLEAMACGCPVVSSQASSLPEVVGDAGLMVDPSDVPALAQALTRVLTDDALREMLVARGAARVQEFTWDRAASEMAALYGRLAKR
ncbi:MAG: glycosyltransferase family 1 protein [Nitrospiraceae bacterium]